MLEGALLANRYRLEQRIGEGGLAAVWRGWDTVLERPVAVKVLRCDLAQDPQVVSRFRREAHAAAKLNHPHIVQLYDTGHDEPLEAHFIVMEYLPEPDLKRIISQYAPLPPRKVIEVASQCCRALAYAHRQGLVHRDVKPHNILFTDEGLAKLSDFGIAAAIGESGAVAPGLVMGTANYVSPEQAQGKSVGPASDLYSLGCVMFEALTGRPPFVGDSAAEVAAMHVNERAPSARSLNAAITPSVEYVLTKALARDANRRYHSAEEMLEDLDKLAAGEDLDRTGVISRTEERTMPLQVTRPAEPAWAPPAAAGPPPPVRTSAPERRDGSLVWGTLLAVVIALLALGATAWLVYVAFYPHRTPAMVQVPALVGRTETDARLSLAEVGLRLGRIERDTDPAAPAGTILSQSPLPGQTVTAGSTVDIAVNQGVEVARVPALADMSLNEATVALQRAGFALGRVTQEGSAGVPEGRVIEQNIAAGTSVEKGSQVDLVVSKGPEPEVTIPEPPPTPVRPAVAVPRIECKRDESYRPADPREARYLLTITGQGETPRQRVRVVKRDETGAAQLVHDGTIDPGMSKELSIVGRGNTLIQVYHEGELADEFNFPAPAAPGGNAGAD